MESSITLPIEVRVAGYSWMSAGRHYSVRPLEGTGDSFAALRTEAEREPDRSWDQEARQL